MVDDGILEPVKYYRENLKDGFAASAEKFFDELVKSSGINADENRATAKKYRAKQTQADEAKKKLRALKTVRIFLVIVSLICFGIGLALLINAAGETVKTVVGIMLLFVAAGTMASVFIAFNKKIGEADGRQKKLQKEADGILAIARAQMEPLNSAFDGDMTRKLITEAVPLLKIDRNFSMKRFDYMRGKYGFRDNDDPTESTINLLSGEIVGNPFLIERRLKMHMGTHTYFGSRVITYTQHYRDEKGNMRTRVVTQTLTASVTKPMPYYKAATVTVYGNDAAPDLSFSRKPTHAERLTDKQVERKVRRGSEKLRKKAEKQVGQGGGNFTQMGDERFDVLFGASDRDNEVQFRLLFTALAQKNIVELIRGGDAYGDDFYFRKAKCLNYIKSEHMQSWNMDAAAKNYFSYDVDIAKKNFTSFNNNYFKALFFEFAPILSIPLYQQQKPREYIYGESFYRNMTSYEAEVLANSIGARKFAHPSTATDVILKTQLMTKVGKSDRLSIRALSFRTEKRCDSIPVLGGDGKMHLVPVFWDEYIPIENLSVMDMKELGLSDKEANESEKIRRAADRSKGFSYTHGIFACTLNDGNADLDKEIDL